MRLRKFSFIFISLLIFLLVPVAVQAQDFAGSDPNNYYCPAYTGLDVIGADDLAAITRAARIDGFLVTEIVETEGGAAVIIDNTNNYICVYENDSNFEVRNAAPKPPTLQIVQVWFVRLVYVIWAVSGVVFTLALMWIGFKYLTSFGNEYAQGGVIKDLRKWLVGLVLVFLSYPVLNTFYNILPLSETACFSDINVIGFQFFFPDACITTPEDIVSPGDRFTPEPF